MKCYEGRVLIEKSQKGETLARPAGSSTRAQVDLLMYMAERLSFQFARGPVDADDSRYFVTQKERVEGDETRYSIQLKPSKK